MSPYYFQVTAALLKWLMESLSKCKSQECLQLYVNALQNTQNSKLAQLLFMLLEDNCHAGKGGDFKYFLLRFLNVDLY